MLSCALRSLINAACKILLTGLVKPLDAEWQKCRGDLDRDCSRIRTLAQATEAELRRQRDLERAANRQGWPTSPKD